jgi:hypothetical protein
LNQFAPNCTKNCFFATQIKELYSKINFYCLFTKFIERIDFVISKKINFYRFSERNRSFCRLPPSVELPRDVDQFCCLYLKFWNFKLREDLENKKTSHWKIWTHNPPISKPECADIMCHGSGFKNLLQLLQANAYFMKTKNETYFWSQIN